MSISVNNTDSLIVDSECNKDTEKILLQLLQNVETVNFRKIVFGKNAENEKLKLAKKHYLVICIEELLKLAKKYHWQLCKKNDNIYLYNSEYWVLLDKEGFQSFLGNVALQMGVDKYDSKFHSFKEDLYKQFLAEAYLPSPEVEKDTVLINLLNGTLEITQKGANLREFRSEDFLTYQLSFKYDSRTKGSLWQKFLNEVLPDESKQKVLAEFFGYIFINPNVLKLEKVLMLYGGGSNGKSVVFEVLNAMLGEENVSNYSLESLTNQNGYYRAMIGDKLVNYASELSSKLDTTLFKQLASCEPIDARLPYGNPFKLKDYAKMVFNANILPDTNEATHAFFRRFLIIHFDKTIEESQQDKELSKKIIDAELPAVLNWVLEGLNRLLEQKNFTKSAIIDSALKAYKIQSDTVQMFVTECCYMGSLENYELVKDLYNLYRSYCIEDGYFAVNKNEFKKRLSSSGVAVKRLSVGNVAYLEKH